MTLYTNRGTPIRDKEGTMIMRGEKFDSARVDKRILVRRAHQFREVGSAPEPAPPSRARVMNVPPKDEPEADDGPPEFSGSYNIDDLHTGSGWYSLPTGVRVRGKEAAAEALEELTSGD